MTKTERDALIALCERWAKYPRGSQTHERFIELRALIPDLPSGPTTRARIAVEAIADGSYSAGGWGTDDGPAEDGHMLSNIAGWTDETSRVSYVEVDVPLPEPVETVEGEVVT